MFCCNPENHNCKFVSEYGSIGDGSYEKLALARVERSVGNGAQLTDAQL
jgi:hypothetical protein